MPDVFFTVDLGDPVLPAPVIAASIGTTAGTLAAGDAVAAAQSTATTAAAIAAAALDSAGGPTGELVAGVVVVTVPVVQWGITGSGRPYFDPAGAADDEHAVLFITDTGRPALAPLGGTP